MRRMVGTGKRRLGGLLTVLLLGSIIATSIVGWSAAVIVPLTARSLAPGSPQVSAVTTHTFGFTFQNSTPVGSMVFEYCMSPLESVVCTAPSGLDVSSATLTAQSGATGFGIFDRTQNSITISRAPTVNASGMASLRFSNVTNPSFVGTFYVRISAYDTQDASNAEDAFGAVASSTSEAIGVSTEVPPILNFCVGITIGADCSSASDNLIELGYLSDSKASAGTSQMMVGTNANYGATITATGTTMTSGNNVIPALTIPTASAPGNSQFGINLRANSDPAVGADPSGPGTMQPTLNYNIPNEFIFKDNDVVASVGNVTDTRKFTVSYIVNISPTQPPGVYNTTVTYVCAATF